MKNNKLDTNIKTALQEHAAQYETSPQMKVNLMHKLDELQKKESEPNHLQSCHTQMFQRTQGGNKMKHFHVKKAIIATAAAVMALGTVTVLATGGVKNIISSSTSFPDYTKYADLTEAEGKAGVTTNAPERFSNGYVFYGINLEQNSYRTEEDIQTDSFTSLSIEYHKGSDIIDYSVQPRPMLADTKERTEAIEEDGITYYYQSIQNKFVPLNYEPTAEEYAQMEAGTLNIGVGADKISYSIGKHIWWEINGQQHLLFCMDNDISKEKLLDMALELR